MKTIKTIATVCIVAISVLLTNCGTTASRDPYTGRWEGPFMGDFRVMIQLSLDESGSYTGRIQTFSGENTIQDDSLSRIVIDNRRFTFYIPAKESEFRGSIDPASSEISGYFTFPDQAQHPLTVHKTD